MIVEYVVLLSYSYQSNYHTFGTVAIILWRRNDISSAAIRKPSHRRAPSRKTKSCWIKL